MKKVIRTPDFPIVTTKQGKLHGFQEDDVYQFRGIRYGTAERFELPRAEEPWEGVRDAKAYGYVCPLMPEEPHAEDDPMSLPQASFEMPHVFWPESENCLYLNVWTKHLDPAAKRPVMLWLHGGGYAAGSSIEIPAYDGHNLADHGDVVIVSLNHRLNCIGFLDLSSFGEDYRYSGCLGMADIVLALQWIRDNIASFGGDPGNVTVAGQSGGGGKAAALLQMPPADGLYHGIIIQSGAFRSRSSMTAESEKRRWQALGEKTVEILELSDADIDEIRHIPYERLARAAQQAGKELGYPAGLMLFEPSPTENFYTGLSNVVGFREETRQIPVIAGTVLGEFSFSHDLGDKSRYSEEEKRKILEKTFGEDTERIVGLFHKVYPGMDILYALSVDTLFRPGTVRFLCQRAAFTYAPCYNYMMSFIMPYMGGTAPWHCSCIPYVFRNVEMEPAHCTGHAYAASLQDCVSDAWTAFMEKKDPSTPGLPWQKFTTEDHARMIFAENCGISHVDDSELLELTGRHAFFPG
ncbi:MAG: carboxylesterase family protein [Lachnospiraceae bacterium]|jgi:para-nitrobenzyl esterase|nr:carboxylesterase family protein [Lachnospiraceae bacterium]